ncbi:MAG: porphobilinogen synthase [Chloroflexota bacterium]
MLKIRPRRLRHTPQLRRMVQETTLTPADFIYPMFVVHGNDVHNPIGSMPGIAQLSVNTAVAEAQKAYELGIPAVLLFGIPAEKDPIGVENFADDGIVQQATRAIKAALPNLLVVTDVCLCEYTDHGHCGILNTGEHLPMLPEGYVLNDETLDILGKVSLSHAKAGADIIAPSGMIDGMVSAIRTALDDANYDHLPIMSYAVKYASGFYGPFRDAADGAPKFGDRKTHQMDPANSNEALREAAIDVAEGADFLMVKPALSYLDVIHRLKTTFPELPLAAYNVSGEYSMIKAASANGWLDEKTVTLEKLTSIKRAGADVIITYHAVDAATWLKG